MGEFEALADFRFLRPIWLVALPLLAIVWWRLRVRAAARDSFGGMIAPHLYDALVVGREGQGGLKPIDVSVLVLGLMSVAAAGPAWQREFPPFLDPSAPLVIAIDGSQSMGEKDVQPSRIVRAGHKVRDLLGLRDGARTGLVLFADTAHLVLPLTDDRELFGPYLEALDTDLVPQEGRNLDAVLDKARGLLASEEVAPSVLLITDELSASEAEMLRDAEGLDVYTLIVRGDGSGSGGRVVWSTVDGSDIRELDRLIRRGFVAGAEALGEVRWRDAGYYLLIPILLAVAFGYRRGWTMRWVVMLPLLVPLLAAPEASAEEAPGTSLWWTADQQGRLAFERGEYERAARLFADPHWRGAAHYRAGEFEAAAIAFAEVTSAEGAFNLGNANARLGDYAEAIAAYDLALAIDPAFDAAAANRALVVRLMEQERLADEQEGNEEAPPPTLDPDDIVMDDKAEKGQVGEVEAPTDLTAEAAEQWMRQVENRPAEFLRRKFAIEAGLAGDGGGP